MREACRCEELARLRIAITSASDLLQANVDQLVPRIEGNLAGHLRPARRSRR